MAPLSGSGRALNRDLANFGGTHDHVIAKPCEAAGPAADWPEPRFAYIAVDATLHQATTALVISASWWRRLIASTRYSLLQRGSRREVVETLLLVTESVWTVCIRA